MGIPFHEVRLWSASEILLYQCYYRIAPWGEDRGDIRNAMSMAQTANLLRDTATHSKPYVINDFMPFREHVEETEDAVTGNLKDAFMAFKK